MNNIPATLCMKKYSAIATHYSYTNLLWEIAALGQWF